MDSAGRYSRGAIGGACAVLALASLLSGCAAAVVVPALAAGGVLAGSRNDGSPRQEEPSAVPAGNLVVFAGDLPAPSTLPPQMAGQARSGPAGAADWRSFADYTLEREQGLGGFDPVASALLVPGSELDLPDRLPCKNLSPAVIVDLDPAGGVFAPQSSLQPASGVAESLAQLRGAGVTIMWVSKADANSVSEIGDALRASGLDPSGKDPLLLVRNPSERKQVMRMEASSTACIIAIAGDERSDFDELFDYLRDPDLGVGLDVMLGDGWFLLPPPLAPVAPAMNPQT